MASFVNVVRCRGEKNQQHVVCLSKGGGEEKAFVSCSKDVTTTQASQFVCLLEPFCHHLVLYWE